MEVQFTISVQDLRTYFRYSVLRSKLQIVSVLMVATWLPFALATLVSVIWGYQNRIALIVLLTLSLMAFVYVLIRHYFALYVGNDDRFGDTGDYILGFSPEGINERTAFSETFRAWSRVNAIEATAAHIYLFVGSSGTHIVPARIPQPG